MELQAFVLHSQSVFDGDNGGEGAYNAALGLVHGHLTLCIF